MQGLGLHSRVVYALHSSCGSFAEAAAAQAQAASEQLQLEIERLKTEAAEAQMSVMLGASWGTA